jgi:hypothetical protein
MFLPRLGRCSPAGRAGQLGSWQAKIPQNSPLEEASGGVPFLQAEQVGGGGQACPDDDLRGFAAFPLQGLAVDLPPGDGEFDVGGGLDAGSAGADDLGDARMPAMRCCMEGSWHRPP